MLPQPIESFSTYPTSCDTVIVVRDSDGKAWEFKNQTEAGTYFFILYNRVDGDESRVINPKPLAVLPKCYRPPKAKNVY